ncbi:heat shock protein 75 kDa, mitochondrial-like isoform X2 [Oscarella lobularis]|uniref:heat shock protein 75 kDa, mitochondrial-like isoform X2 n=1 Tax=Oscarella lobularis TaxID=121494 RepID=UPI00331441C3
MNYTRLAKLVLRSALNSPVRTTKPLLFRHSYRLIKTSTARMSSESSSSVEDSTDAVNQGPIDRREFKAETRQLLDIVAKSLYSEKEVFIRELISNASDALEKLRHHQVNGVTIDDFSKSPLEIRITTDSQTGTITIQDFGTGMSKEDMVENLGTIARSGTKAFLSEIEDEKSSSSNSLIGQFGVGFYSTFMVADKVKVNSRSFETGSQGYTWSSDGSGLYEISEASHETRGTKIVVQLKADELRFADRDTVEGIVKKYSNFVGFPIFLNGEQINTIQPLWTQDPKAITTKQHEEFYQFISNAFDKPRYTLHFVADAPLSIRSLFYVPEQLPEMYGVRVLEPGVSLYSRRVLIQSKARDILPEWLRFVRGVIDSEDIPLNLSRELLQQSALIQKLRSVLSSKLIRFLADEAKRDRKKYEKFFAECGIFLREGIVSASDDAEREEIAKLFRFESSFERPGVTTSLSEYVSRMKPGQKNIYYLCLPTRELAETSPYYEPLLAQGHEVLFSYDQFDDTVLAQLRSFNEKPVLSAESYLSKSEEEGEVKDGSLPSDEADSLVKWLTRTLGYHRVKEVKVSRRLSSHPTMLTVSDMVSARRFLRAIRPEERGKILQPTLEVNPSHTIIKRLATLKDEDTKLAVLVAEQLYDNALIAAGLMDDPRRMLGRLDSLVESVVREQEK